MARYSYVPYDEAFIALFEYCHITPPAVIDYGGGRTGWDPKDFDSAAVAAQTYLFEIYSEDNAELVDSYIAMLESYSVNYWSTEAPNTGL